MSLCIRCNNFSINDICDECTSTLFPNYLSKINYKFISYLQLLNTDITYKITLCRWCNKNTILLDNNICKKCNKLYIYWPKKKKKNTK